MRVLVVNTGSSSAKLAVLDVGADGGTDGGGTDGGGTDGGGTEHPVELEGFYLDPWGGDPAALGDAIGGLVERAGPIDAVGHRVVHGGSDFGAPTLLDAEVRQAIADLAPLAPLHQERALAGIEATYRALPGVPAVACFDTAFHHDLPAAAATYAVPGEWRARWDLRRRGFHGLSHAWAARRGASLAGLEPSRARVVTCHLGGGASLAAVAGGRSVDTTMGMTPLEGLVMTTRSGSVDPGLVLWLLGEGGLDLEEVAEGLQRRGGLAALAGRDSGDLREILPAAGAGDPDAELALAVFHHRLRAAIAAMAASLGGIDVLAFTGGAGQHQPAIRAGATAGLEFLGVVLDEAANERACDDADVSGPLAGARTVVVATGEEAEIARAVAGLLG